MKLCVNDIISYQSDIISIFTSDFEFLSTHEIIWLGFVRTCNVQELFQLQFNAVQLFIQPIVVDPNGLLFVNASFQFDSPCPLLFVRIEAKQSSCWCISILCNKNCPLNKQNLQFK